MLIAFAGLPSCGKSTTAKALGELLNTFALLEPEESAWPELVRERDTMGAFTALTWFRTVRVPQLFQADALRQQGNMVVLDSYYDVLVARYLGESAFEWLLHRDDPYFQAAENMVRADWDLLPKADVLVFLRLDESTWCEFMDRRNRDFDRTADLRHHFEMQNLMELACKQAEVEHGTRLVIVDQYSSTPMDTARRVAGAVGLHG